MPESVPPPFEALPRAGGAAQGARPGRRLLCKPCSLWPLPLGMGWGEDSAWPSLDHFPSPTGCHFTSPCRHHEPQVLGWLKEGWGGPGFVPICLVPWPNSWQSHCESEELTLPWPLSDLEICTPSPSPHPRHFKEAHSGPQSLYGLRALRRVRMTCLFPNGELEAWRGQTADRTAGMCQG